MDYSHNSYEECTGHRDRNDPLETDTVTASKQGRLLQIPTISSCSVPGVECVALEEHQWKAWSAYVLYVCLIAECCDHTGFLG